MGYQLRAFDIRADAARVVDIVNSFQTIKTSVEELRHNHTVIPTNTLRHEVVALDETGDVIGWGVTQCVPWRAADQFTMMMGVDPTFRRRGVGTTIHDALAGFAAEHGGLRFNALVRDDMPEAVTFAEKRGFKIDRHIFESVLDVETFDEKPFRGVVDEVRAHGITFKTYAQLGDSEENRKRFYEVMHRSFRDVPGNDYPNPPYEEWVRSNFDDVHFSAEGTVFALDGEQWVGLARLNYFHEQGFMLNAFTGIDGAYRGKKIALALKLLTIEYARKQGVGMMRTYNDALNGPMLAINRKLGYQPMPGVYRMRKGF